MMKTNVTRYFGNLGLVLAAVFALATAASAQRVINLNITAEMVKDAQKSWCDALVKINRTKEEGGDYRKVASDVIDAAYGYQMGLVLFKPTLTTGDQTFRKDKEGALAYFVGGDPNYKDDTGFALRGWTRCESEPRGFILNGDMAISMGNVHIWDRNGNETFVDKTWGYKLDDQGKLRIILHHSSLPYKPAK